MKHHVDHGKANWVGPIIHLPVSIAFVVHNHNENENISIQRIAHVMEYTTDERRKKQKRIKNPAFGSNQRIEKMKRENKERQAWVFE